MIAVIAFTKKGCALGKELARELSASLWTTDRLAEAMGLPGCGELRRWTEERFGDCRAMVFVSAAGIAVRAIAPFVKDKFTDPAVVSVDEEGRFVLPLLSGHVGGANDLARHIAKITGGEAAVSTATDVNGLFAVDQWAVKQNLVLVERRSAKMVSAALLEGQSVGLRSDWDIRGTRPKGLCDGADPAVGIRIGTSTLDEPFPTTLHLIPRAITIGIGCRRGTEAARLEEGLNEFLRSSGIPAAAICGLASIDLKRHEPGLLALAEAHGWPLTFFTAEELAAEQGDFAPSPFVQSITGVDNVCQRAAQRAGGTVIVPKAICGGATFAAAVDNVNITWNTQEESKE